MARPLVEDALRRVLVTGAAGFLGGHLVTELVEAGYEVTAVDKPEGDLTDRVQAQNVLAEAKPEVVFHLAAQVGRLFCEQDLGHTIRSNVVATANVAEWCRDADVELIHTSTSEVYGEHGNEVCHEDMPLTAVPTGIYAMGKRWGEEAVRNYGPKNAKVVRPSMPYGCGAPPGVGRRALDNFLWLAHHRQPIEVHRGAARSWCWVGDTVRGFRMVMEKGEPGAYNIGRDDAEVSMFDLACRACEMTGAPFELITVVDPPTRQTVVKRLSNQKLIDLGWQATVELDAGMAEVLNWVREFPFKS